MALKNAQILGMKCKIQNALSFMSLFSYGDSRCWWQPLTCGKTSDILQLKCISHKQNILDSRYKIKCKIRCKVR